MNNIEMNYMYQPPNKWTFKQPQLKAWVESWCMGRTLNLFAGQTKLSIDNEVRVDISSEFNPDYISDAYDFIVDCIRRGDKFDTVVLDPPYNLRKSREKYNGNWIGSFTKIKNILPNIVASGGRVITLGYDTVGMSKSRGFKKIAVCVVCHSGDHRDTLCVVEEKEEN